MGTHVEVAWETCLQLAVCALPGTLPGALLSLAPSPPCHITLSCSTSSQLPNHHLFQLKDLFLLTPGYFHKSFILKINPSVSLTTTFLKFIPLPHASANMLIPEGAPSHLNVGNILASWLSLLPPSSLPERKWGLDLGGLKIHPCICHA